MGLCIGLPCVRPSSQNRSSLWMDVPSPENTNNNHDEVTISNNEPKNPPNEETSETTPSSTTSSSLSSTKSGNISIYLNHAGQAPMTPFVRQSLHKVLDETPTHQLSSIAQQTQATIRILFAQLLNNSSNNNKNKNPNPTKHSKKKQQLTHHSHPEEDSARSGCTHHDIALMPSTAFAMTLAAHNILRHPHVTPHDDASIQSSNKSWKRSMIRKRQSSSSVPQSYKILVLQDQYPSAIYPWQELIHQHNNNNNNPKNTSSHSNNNIHWSLHVVPYPQDTRHDNSVVSWTDLILEHLHHLEHTIRVVALPPVHWATGQRIDLAIIGDYCAHHQQHLIVDATQAVGILPLPHTLTHHASLIACSVHKWLRSPTNGVSCVYIHPALHDTWQPLDQHERGRQFYCGNKNSSSSNSSISPAQQALATRHFMNPTTGCYPAAYATNARKFDAGGKANPLLLTVVAAAMKQVVVARDIVSVEAAQKHLERLLRPFRQWCRVHGFRFLMDGGASHHNHQQQHILAHHILHIGLPRGIIPSRHNAPKEAAYLVLVANRLEKEFGIVVAARCGGLRISPSLETTSVELQALQKALYEIIFRPHQQISQQEQQQLSLRQSHP